MLLPCSSRTVQTFNHIGIRDLVWPRPSVGSQPRYRAIRAARPSCRTFFERVRTLLHYLPFDHSGHLMAVMLTRLTPKPHKTGSCSTYPGINHASSKGLNFELLLGT